MVIPASDILTVDVGGRLFKTTVNTLVSSGAKFFQALFGQTGLALADSTTVVTPKEAKRGRTEAQDVELPQSIFVDSDPDIFADVLYFMRRNCISPKTAADPLRLKMLQTEADFFIYDDLSDACAKQLADIAVYSATAIVSGIEEPVIKVPKGQVLFIVSATLAGDCDDEGDFQLFCYTKSKNSSDDDGCCIAHVGSCDGTPMNFRHEIRTCFSATQDVVTLSAEGPGDWHVHYWVGPVGRIPQLLGESGVTQK